MYQDMHSPLQYNTCTTKKKKTKFTKEKEVEEGEEE